MADIPESNKPLVVLDPSKVPTREAEDYRLIYVNSSRMGISPWDIRMVLGRTIIAIDNKETVIEDCVTLLMSPQHAKAMLNSLIVTLASYEKLFGEISDNQKILSERTVAKSPKSRRVL